MIGTLTAVAVLTGLFWWLLRRRRPMSPPPPRRPYYVAYVAYGRFPTATFAVPDGFRLPEQAIAFRCEERIAAYVRAPDLSGALGP